MSITASFCLLVVVAASGVLCSPEEVHLVETLLDGYNVATRNVIPNERHGEALDVQQGLSLVKILDFDDKENFITLHGWIRMTWNDHNLRWNPEEHSGITQFRLRNELIWTPDFEVFDGNDAVRPETKGLNTVVSSNGDVIYVPMTTLRVGCDTEDEENYSCSIKMGSWTYSGNEMNLDFYGPADIDVTYLKPSTQFEVVSHAAERHVEHYPGLDEPYIDLTFTLGIRRKAEAGSCGN